MDVDGGQHVAADIGRDQRPFTLVAAKITAGAGSGTAAAVVILAVVVWFVVGTITGFDRWWQAVVNVVLAVVTLLMLVLIQHTQNHDDQAVQLKLDELIRASAHASNEMMVVEEASPEALDKIQEAFKREAAAD